MHKESGELFEVLFSFEGDTVLVENWGNGLLVPMHRPYHCTSCNPNMNPSHIGPIEYPFEFEFIGFI